MTPRRVVVAGVVVCALYALVASWSAGRVPFRPLFDGLAPPAPYRWVSPPPDYVGQNQKPSGATRKLALKPGGTDEASVATLDGQATLILPQGAFAARPGSTGVVVDITPADPAKEGRPPPGLGYSGNAYVFRARYEPGGAEAAPAMNVTVLIQHPTFVTTLLQKSPSGWTLLQATDVAASLQIFAKTRTLGTFVAAGHQAPNSLRWITLGSVSGFAALLGAAFGLRERRRLRRPKRRRAF